jgi:hypothetical protein
MSARAWVVSDPHFGHRLLGEGVDAETGNARYLNVCVERTDYTPVSMDHIFWLAEEGYLG